MSEVKGDAQAIIEAVQATAEPQILAPGTIYLLTESDGSRRVIDTDAYSLAPRRVARTIAVDNVPSLLSDVTKHSYPNALEVWADQSAAQVVAILDAPEPSPAWCGHRATYQLRHTPEWETWAAGSGKLIGQTEFAELIEDRAADITAPEPATMLELAQTFEATTKVDFQSASWLASGQRALTYQETIEAKAGRKGAITIPAAFDLALRPWWGCAPYRVTARLRYRIEGGKLRIGYKLADPARVLEAAFGDVLAEVQAGLDVSVTVRRGRP